MLATAVVTPTPGGAFGFVTAPRLDPPGEHRLSALKCRRVKPSGDSAMIVIGRRGSLGVEELCRNLAEAFPGTEVVTTDWYSDLLARQLKLGEPYGMAPDNVVFESTRRAAEQCGTCWEIDLALSDDRRIRGRVWRTSCLFSSKTLERSHVSALVEFLQAHGLDTEVLT